MVVCGGMVVVCSKCTGALTFKNGPMYPPPHMTHDRGPSLTMAGKPGACARVC